MDDYVIGIDLGTTFSCVAAIRDGRPEVLPSSQGYKTVPSVVSLDRKGRLITGQPALDQIETHPNTTIYGAKRLIGRPYNSRIVQDMTQYMSYPIVEGENGEAAVELGGNVMSLQEISSLILREIHEIAEGNLDQEIKRAVITVPAYYNDAQRQAVKEAGAMAGLRVARIINEPTAAGIAYGYGKNLKQTILVYDLGGGTFDASIMEINDTTFRVLGTGGDTFLGGVDFDLAIAEHMREEFEETYGLDLSGDRMAMVRLRATAERAKRQLSSIGEVDIQLPFLAKVDGEPVTFDTRLTRQLLDRLCMTMVRRTLNMCQKLLDDLGIKPEDIDEILLVGGQTRMPLIQHSIARFFKRLPRKGVHPDEVVAVGAAILGNALAKNSPLKLKDVLAIPIGLKLPNGKFKPILQKNIPLPASKKFQVSMRPDQGLNVEIYQGESSNAELNEHLGIFKFPKIKTVHKLPTPMQMNFILSEEGILKVVTRNLNTGKQEETEMETAQASPGARRGQKGPLSKVKGLLRRLKR